MKRIIFILALIYNLTFVIENCSSQWSQVNLPMSGQIVKVQFVNQNTGWLLLKNSTIYTLLKTSNGGVNWSPVYADSMKIMTFQFVNDSVGYGMGRAYIYDMLSKTTNGGMNWTVMQSTSSYIYNGIYFVSQDTGWVETFSLSAENVFRTTNGLQTLENICAGPSGFGGTPATLFFFKERYNNQNYGYELGGGHLWKTTNSGYNWTQLSFSNYINSFSFINKDTGWVVLNSSQRQILKTTNGGDNWLAQYTDNLSVLSPLTVFAVNKNNIWCSTNTTNYRVMATTNSGQNWGNQLSPLGINYGIFMYDTSLGFLWDDIHLLRTTNGGGQINSIEKISEVIPNSFELKQNYPNPFNPSTNIEFQISSSSAVYLDVFDLIGRKVAELIGGKELQAGYYRYNLDLSGKNFASGVYFYRLTAYTKSGNKLFATTRKMLMIK